jgi:neutral ceramidase
MNCRPVVEINMMGYADTKQVGSGLRQRLYSRAFIVGDVKHTDDRFVYLVLDTQSGDTAVRYGILEGLKALGSDYDVYGQHNVAVTGTHSHSGPGAWLNYLLPQITSKGFDKQSYRAIVNGAVLSIQRAHRSLQPGYLTAGTTKVFGANINRSLYAYFANPDSERARYNNSIEDDGSVEKTLTLLKFQRASDGKNTGVLTWFPTHGTSMLGNNTIISGDNKGVAADLFEKSFSAEDNVADDFVAGFSQASVGDTSPNVLGAWCEDGTGRQCSFENSTCSDGKSQYCHARGPFFRVKDNGASSCFEIGKRQFEPARSLYDTLHEVGVPITGPTVKSFHTFQDMSNFSFPLSNGSYVSTCPAALGYSFAAGTSDGPGAFDFTQNDPNVPNASPIWRVVSSAIKEPTKEQKRCHFPKPILLDVGEISTPYLWTPNVVDVQVFRVGQFVIIVSPGEATTMAGRRWKEAIHNSAAAQTLSGSNSDEPIVVLGGPANSYTHYISTPEEYGIQRYEGASTLYGQYTLNAYINLTLTYLHYLSASSTSQPEPGPSPPDNTNRSLSFITGVVYDGTPIFKSYGDVKRDVRPAYSIRDIVSATFVGANPRNNLRLEQTYATIEKMDPEFGRWMRVRDDSDWSLIFNWKRTSEVLGTSEVEIVWETEGWAEPGQYRIRYYGDHKSVGGSITAFEGLSGEFVLT